MLGFASNDHDPTNLAPIAAKTLKALARPAMSVNGTKRTFAVAEFRSAYDPKRTFSTGRITPLLDRADRWKPSIHDPYHYRGQARELGGLMAEAMCSSKSKG